MFSGLIDLISLQMYPACLLFYSTGLGAIADNHYDALKSLCRDIQIIENGQERLLIRVVLPWSVLRPDIANQLPGYGSRYTSMNDRIFDILREPMREYVPDDERYADMFDRLEYLSALVHLDIRMATGDPHAPVGRFMYRPSLANKSVVERVSEEAKKYGEDWAIISSGLFPSVGRFQEVAKIYREEIMPRAWY